MERPSSSVMQMLYAELASVKAQNTRLDEENVLLRHKLNRASTDQHTTATVNVEAKIRAFQLEEERDHLLDTLQTHKKKYNKLHDAYIEKVKRCKALEEMFKRQKTLTGLVMKSAIAQRQSEQALMLEKRQSQQSKSSQAEVEELKAKLAKMQLALDESYDIIDEMDFELESVDLLEMQNKSLREELATLKAQLEAVGAHASEIPDDDDPPPKYEPAENFPAQSRRNSRRQVVSSNCNSCLKIDDANSDSLERAALTHSLLETVESESNCLRRELLRSRCQRAVQAKQGKEQKEEDV